MSSLLNYIDQYRSGYRYKWGGDGSDGGIDCSHLVYAILDQAGYNFPYAQVDSMEKSGNFIRIPPDEVQPGDLVVFINHNGQKANHVGIVTSIAGRNSGVYFGSQSSTGPKEAEFGPRAGYWKNPTYFLRPKDTKAAVAQPQPKTAPLNWAYPVKLNMESSRFVPVEYFEGLSRARGGCYPLGQNGLLHPAIHFDQGASSRLDITTIHAIADGEIVAYRMDPEPLVTRYPQDNVLATYSSSFVLIKHRLTLPHARFGHNDQNQLNTSQVNKEPAGSITLFSLYMHLANASQYADANLKLPKPPYLSAEYRVKQQPSNHVMGLRVRNKPRGTVLAIIPLGTKVKLGDALPNHASWKKLAGVSNGPLCPVDAMPIGLTPFNQGYIYTGSLDSNHTVIKDTDTEPSAIGQRVAHLLLTDNAKHNNVIANLPPGTILELGARSDKAPNLFPVKSISNLQGFPQPKLSGDNIFGWIDESDLDEIGFNASAGVKIVHPPLAIKAGQLLGHAGQYQNHNNAAAQAMVHIELFTPENLPDFMAKSRTWSQYPSIKDGVKTLIKVPRGTKLRTPAVDNSGTLVVPVVNPPKVSDAGTPLHTELILPITALNTLPRHYRMTLPESSTANAKIIQWWYLDNIGGQDNGRPLKGWLCENDIEKASPWEWPGFISIEDDTPDDKLLAYQLKQQNRLYSEEQNTYGNIASEAQFWPTIQQLIETINAYPVERLAAINTLSTSQLLDATAPYWCAQKIASIAIKRKSEWKKDANRWNSLDSLMGHKADNPNKMWEKEKERIEKLSFWDEVKSVVGDNEKVWFLNPIGMVNLFKSRKFSWARSSFGDAVAKYESRGSYTICNRYDSRKDSYIPIRSIDLCSYTVKKVMVEGKNRNIWAAGKFQIIPSTLVDAVNSLKIDTDLFFDEEMQDYIFDEYLIKIKRKPIFKFLEGGGDVEDAIYAWALEWASGGIRKGKKMSRRKKVENGSVLRDENGNEIFHQPIAAVEGVSYYSGDGYNKAHIAPDEMRKCIEDAKQSKL